MKIFKYIINMFLRIKTSFLYLRLVASDAFAYAKYSSTFRNPILDKIMLESRITAYSHTIEKGLSLKEVRPGFGQKNASNLIGLLNIYKRRYGVSGRADVYLNAIGILKSYQNFNRQKGLEIDGLGEAILALSDKLEIERCGVKNVYRENIMRFDGFNFEHFVDNRFSIRDFLDKEVDIEVLKKAIKIAQKAPSVCNRQTARIHIFSDKKAILKILDVQAGSKGFSKYVNKLLLLSSDLRVFHGIQERNQSFIDTGIFSMLLLLSLHYYNLGACPLCWYPEIKAEKKLKDEFAIGPHELIVMCIAVGHIPDAFNVAESKRRKIEEILRIH